MFGKVKRQKYNGTFLGHGVVDFVCMKFVCVTRLNNIEVIIMFPLSSCCCCSFSNVDR